MIEWIDLRPGKQEKMMLSKHLCTIVVVALICITVIELYALNQGINGAYLSAVIAVFAVIVGAVSKKIYDVRKN